MPLAHSEKPAVRDRAKKNWKRIEKFNHFNMAKRGFTLIELLVVISIIGLLSSATLASLNTVRARARDARRLQDIKEIEKALQLYFNEQRDFPDETTSGGSLAGWEASFIPDFIEALQPSYI